MFFLRGCAWFSYKCCASEKYIAWISAAEVFEIQHTIFDCFLEVKMFDNRVFYFIFRQKYTRHDNNESSTHGW